MASLYVSKYQGGWRLVEESYKDGKRSQKTVPRLSYQDLGVNPEWTFLEARDAIKRLNAMNKHRRDQSRIIGSAIRFQNIQSIESAFLPPDLRDEFTEYLKTASFGSDTHNLKVLSHWETVCRIIKELRIDPIDFSVKSDSIYQYLVSKRYSLDYTRKLIRVFNLWGEYISRYRKVGYTGIPTLKGHKKERLQESHQDSTRPRRMESEPLTPEYLSAHSLPEVEHMNWLNLTIWFGLRPIEVDHLKDNRFWRIEKVDGIEVIWVYQTKLTSVAKEKRWKPIPILYQEQKLLISVIKSGLFRRPLVKTLQSYLKTNRIDLYGGRKGFIDLMLDRGQKLEDISAWMGHQSIEMTWKKYRNRRRVSWNKVG